MIRRPGELCVSSRSGGGVGRQRRRQTSVERENQERIDRENRILLRKILEQHHGVRRSSAIPPPPNKAHKQKYPLSSTGKYFLQQGPLTCVDILRWFLTYATTHKGNQVFDLERHRRKPTSNQINQQKMKHKTDYENLLLLQKIQTARPSRAIEQSFDRMKL